MALWQFRVILIPEGVVRQEFGAIPSAVPMEMGEDFLWWSGIQPQTGFERQIDLILPHMESWSKSMRMWGTEDSNDGYVCYDDDSMSVVEEISFRIDARAISEQFVSAICAFAKQLGCVLMTTEYELLSPNASTVLRVIEQSTAKKFVDDPVSTLQSLNETNLEERLNYLTRDKGNRSRKRTD